MIWLLAACSDDPPSGTDDPTTDTSAPTPTGSTGHTGDTGAPCAEAEVPLSGWDDDCDGWADELGPAWPRLIDEAELLLTGPWRSWGYALDVGVGNDGEVWVVAGSGDAYVNTWVVGVSPRLGSEVLLRSTVNDYDYFGDDVAVGQLSSPGFLLAWGMPVIDGRPGGKALLFAPDPPDQTRDDWVGYTLPRDNATGVDSMFVTGDLTGDGFDELVVRDWLDNLTHVRVLDGAEAGLGWSAEIGRITTGDTSFVQNFGNYVGELADVTGDGVIDLPIYSEEDGGRVWIVSSDDLAQNGVVQDLAVAVLSGEVADDDAGWDPTAGDANGDGYTDLLVGAPLAAARRGKSYLVLGPIVEDRALANADAAFVGTWDYDWCGAAQTFVPDSDGDFADEPVVACSRDKYQGYPAPGRVHLLHGPSMSGDLDHEDALRTWVGNGPWDLTGIQIDGEHDVDGDGFADLVVSAPKDADQGLGSVYLLPGPLVP